MTQHISTMEMRKSLGDILNRVELRHDEYIVERKGKPLAAVVPVERIRKLERIEEDARRRALEYFELGKNNPKVKGMTDDDIMKMVNEEIEAMRKERRERGEKS